MARPDDRRDRRRGPARDSELDRARGRHGRAQAADSDLRRELHHELGEDRLPLPGGVQLRLMARPVVVLTCMLVLGGCAPSSGPGASTPAGQRAAPARPLSILVGREPLSLSLKALGQALSTIASTRRLFNATLTLIDAGGTPHPYLAEALPQLNTDSWRVAPDGHMETTYPLRGNTTWHDGTPLTANDFVFSWRVYSEAQLGQAS